jgi:hypothetical protein
MKYLKKYNESNEIDSNDLDNLINPIKDGIRYNNSHTLHQ